MFSSSKYYCLIFLLYFVLTAQTTSSLFNSAVELGVRESDDSFDVTMIYDFEGPIKSRRFENLRSKSRLDALDQIAAHIYINTVYNIKMSELAHPSVFVDAVAVLKPFKVRAKVSQLKTVDFSRTTPKKVKAVYSIEKDHFQITALTKSSLAGLSVKEILKKARSKSHRQQELLMWLLDETNTFHERTALMDDLKLSLKFTADHPLPKQASNTQTVNEVFIHILEELPEAEAIEFVREGQAYLAETSYRAYSNFLTGELLKYGHDTDILLQQYVDNLHFIHDDIWADLVDYVRQNSAANRPKEIDDSMVIIDRVYEGCGLLNLKNDEYDDEYRPLYIKGVEAFKQSKIDSALVYFLKSIEMESIDDDAFNFTGNCYRLKNEPVYALPFLMQCLNLNSRHEYAWSNLAKALQMAEYPHLDAFLGYAEKAAAGTWSEKSIAKMIRN